MLGGERASVVRRLRLNDKAREDFFGTMATAWFGDHSRRCRSWGNVQLLLFPFGAVFVFSVEWDDDEGGCENVWTEWSFDGPSPRFGDRISLGDVAGWLLKEDEAKNGWSCQHLLLYYVWNGKSSEIAISSPDGEMLSLSCDNDMRLKDVLLLLTVHVEAERTLMRNLSHLAAIKSDLFLKSDDSPPFLPCSRWTSIARS